MLDPEVLQAAVAAVSAAQARLTRRVIDGRDSEEPAMTSNIVANLEREFEDIPGSGLRLSIRVLDSAGRGSSESRLGADICTVIDMEPEPGRRITKGFLAQAKRSGRDGLTYSDATANDYSHWLYRSSVELDMSGIVRITKPSELLAKQCKDMLRVTADSFVWVYAPTGVFVVGAAPVLAAFGRPRASGSLTLGTKLLEDFLIHCFDCFIGDPRIRAHDTASLLRLCEVSDARYGVLVEIAPDDSERWHREA